jgi:rhodanese-related sulfurtransferase
MNQKWLIWVVVGIALVGIVYLTTRPAGGSAKGLVNVDASKVESLLAEGGSLHVVDVRTAGEFSGGHLKGAENVPVDQLSSAAAGWDKAQPLLVYCASGSRSASAVQQLQQMGFQTIYHFSQGLVAWGGELDNSASQQYAKAPTVSTNGRPVMYEFFTDW